MQSSPVVLSAAMLRGKFTQRHIECGGAIDSEVDRRRFDAIVEVLAKGGIVALVGRRGTGKTQMATWVTGKIIADGNAKGGWRTDTPAIYQTAVSLFSTLRVGQNEPATFSRFGAVPYLVVDEMQERGDTAFEDRILATLIDRRYASLRGTVLISNLSVAEFRERCGPSVADRIRECGVVIVMEGSSRRNVDPSRLIVSG